MPNKQHKDIADPNIHEPKGVASAGANTVYVADGSGSGTWQSVPGQGNDVVTVNSAADFPAAVSGIRTLAADTTYQVFGDIDVGSDRFILSNNTVIEGVFTSNSSITTTNATNMFTATSVDFLIRNVALTCASATCFNLVGGSTESAVLDTVKIVDCTKVLAASSWYSVYWKEGAVIAGGTGCTFTGTCNTLIMDLVSFVTWDNSQIAVDLGTATFDTCAFIRCGFMALGGTGQTGIDVASSSANINSGKLGRLGWNVFGSTLTNAVANFAESDTRWNSINNAGLLDSSFAAQGSIEGNATATTFSGTGAGNEVAVNFNSAFVADVQNQFSISNAGRFTYNGEITKEFVADVTIFASVAGGASREYIFYIAKNGTIISSSESKRQYDGSNPGANSVSSIVGLANGDYIELYVMANTATTSLTVDTSSIKVYAS